ncbi:MAG: glycosyltransferase family 2 protein [Clostridiales bacterium]|nr:glycosyltransferase family 2 protein [Clostridiales bacterium]
MKKTTVVIPNYNGIRYLEACILSLLKQQCFFDILVIDNGSTDGSENVVDELKKTVECENLRQIRLDHNTGFCGAVNIGIREAQTPYILLLNNDTEVLAGFVERLTGAIESDERLFSVSARMLSLREPEVLDDAGDLYCALGWAFARGKGRPKDRYNKKNEIFAACGGAAIYRREMLCKLGGFDENHFAYLEDIDVGYRALIHGFRNLYEPSAMVLHAGSATTGSAHNPFKVRLSARNSVYLAYKNMPFLQLVLNLPFLLCGHAVKYIFFLKKHLGASYRKGLAEGIALCFSQKGRAHKIKFQWKNTKHYAKIQWLLWKNVINRLTE